MPDRLSFLLAGRPTIVELDDQALFDELARRCENFLIEEPSEPWLVAELRRTDRTLGKIGLSLHEGGLYQLSEAPSTGSLRLGAPNRLIGEVISFYHVTRLLHLGLALALPFDGGLLLHADAVIWRGGALAFLGPSGTGKSTAADTLVTKAGAERLTTDKTVCVVNETPEIITLPPLLEDKPGLARPCSVPLEGLCFPRRAPAPSLRRFGALEGLQRILGAVITLRGKDQPVAETLDLADRLHAALGATEISYQRGQDFSAALLEQRESP